MLFLDAAVLVGVLLILTKVGDLILRPHQQARLQALVEAATLSLSYASLIAAVRRLARRHVWRLVLVLMALVPVQLYFTWPMLGQQLASDPRATEEIVGLVVVMLFATQLAAAIPAAWALRWVLRDDSGRRTLMRFGLLVLALVAAEAAAEWMLAGDPWPLPDLLRRASGLFFLAAGCVVADLFIAAWLFAVALAAHLLLRLVEAVAWRVVEYQRGAWAAVVAIATALLAAVDLYLRRP